MPRDSSQSRIPILQVILRLGAGGTERLVLELCKRLPRHFAPSVCCLDDPGEWARELAPLGIEVAALHRQPGFRPELGLQLAALARRLGARVLHCHQYTPFVYGSLAAMRAPGLRVLFTEHGRLSDAPPSPKRKIANRALQRVPAGIYAVSDDLKRFMVAEGFCPRRISVQPGGVDPGAPVDPAARQRARAAMGVDDGAFVVGTVARLDPVKSLDTLIDACARIEGAQLVLVGDGPERRALEARAAGKAVRFLGHRDDVAALLPAFDVFANTSLQEGVSLTILEAMSAGLPVVATRVGGNPEVVTDACGWLVPARDSSAVAAAVTAARDDVERGQAARRRVLDHFTLDGMVARYAADYEAQHVWDRGRRSA